MTAAPTPPPAPGRDDADLERALAQLPALPVDPERSAALLRTAQLALVASVPRTPAWLGWYERRLEPLLLASACAVYLAWAVAAASPPAREGPAGQGASPARAEARAGRDRPEIRGMSPPPRPRLWAQRPAGRRA